MATKRMLVDATHPEETRIVVTSGNRLEEFDFESASRRQLRGNIYLAKVTRVEPSLQAAFVEYGGNRHGFLAFSEIHPDYYQIPVADREALLAEQAREDHAESEPVEASGPAEETEDAESADTDYAHEAETSAEGDHIEEARHSDQTVEHVGGGDALEELRERRKAPPKKYKIQEVIKRRQVMLVQVVKEERGNKGAALTTYLSLAGRYSVLMPNTARGGGISRKITNTTDRKRLKEIAGDLEVPKGMGVILRTAGAARTKPEVKRDFEYLMRLWENVRSLTLKSQAPSLVYEEGSLIKRTIRDLYNKDIDEVWVAGEDAHREAKDFMRMIMPSHAKNVQLHAEDQPIFSKYAIEPQLDAMFSPEVTLPSGGYIVINPTEALVSIDVNSGRATREHNIEDTALQTNLEAADEVARQLRLRDLAGLIVIDFIDMMEKRSNRNVERRLKEALRHDRARIQVGRISHFGLLEMSRQRMRFGVLESSTHVCPTCQGAGIVRSVESLALMVMRAIEDHVLRRPGQSINVRVPTEVALYILNAKRGTLADIEMRHDLTVTIAADARVVGNHFHIERGETRPHRNAGTPVRVDSAEMGEIVETEEEIEEEEVDEPVSAHPAIEQPERGRRRRRGGRNRQRGADEQPRHETRESEATGTEEEPVEEQAGPQAETPGEADAGEPRRRRRRGRRGGRRNRRDQPFDGESTVEGAGEANADGADGMESEILPVAAAAPMESEIATGMEVAATPSSTDDEAPPARRRGRTRRPRADAAPVAEAAIEPAPAIEDVSPAEEAEDDRPRRTRKELPVEGVIVTSTSAGEQPVDDKPKKAGWWQRGGFLS